MRPWHCIAVLLIAVALPGCAKRQAYGPQPVYGQPPMPAYSQPMPAPIYAQPAAAPGYRAQVSPAPAYVQQAPAQAPVYVQPAQPYPAYAQAPAAPAYAVPAYGGPQGGAYVAAYPSGGGYEQPYQVDSGDRLRISVFGQEGLSNSYVVDAAGFVNMSLIGPVPARGLTTASLSGAISDRLRQGYVREPHVSVEIETYRPFFILGEVTAPGQYPYVANMTVETAIAIAGGYSARAQKASAELTRNVNGQPFRTKVPANYPIRPGDTITVAERWF